jgi:hypothetical protein
MAEHTKFSMPSCIHAGWSGGMVRNGAGMHALHRQRMLPLVRRDAIPAWIERNQPLSGGAWAEMRAAAAAESSDLGYSYGSYDVRGEPPERGAYVRVWARDAGWWLMAAVTEPAS